MEDKLLQLVDCDADRRAIIETLTVAELLALLSTLGLTPKGRAPYGVPRSKLLDTLLEAMDVQPVHANQIKAGCQLSACSPAQ